MGLSFRDKSWLFLTILSCSSLICIVKGSVSYDRKAVIINGQRRILLSGSIHYPRSTPEVIISLFSEIDWHNLNFAMCCVSFPSFFLHMGFAYHLHNIFKKKFIKKKVFLNSKKLNDSLNALFCVDVAWPYTES